MNIIKPRNLWRNINNILIFLIFILFIFFTWLVINRDKLSKGYIFFIEFSNAHGIQEGTRLRMRGIQIGHIKNVKMNLNSILVLAHVDSDKTLIPKNSIIEANQTGLLNDTIIDIIPLDKVHINDVKSVNIFANDCSTYSLICHLDYLEGDRGLNYDDLVRAATRISQRFDDPSFFNVFYLFLQNSLELSDDILDITTEASNLLNLIYKFIYSSIQSD